MKFYCLLKFHHTDIKFHYFSVFTMVKIWFLNLSSLLRRTSVYIIPFYCLQTFLFGSFVLCTYYLLGFRYWLYAAVKLRCLLVTNDEMRDHIFELLGSNFFNQWKERHQVRYFLFLRLLILASWMSCYLFMVSNVLSPLGKFFLNGLSFLILLHSCMSCTATWFEHFYSSTFFLKLVTLSSGQTVKEFLFLFHDCVVWCAH